MVRGWTVFSEVISKVRVSWIPFNLKVIMFHLIMYPIKSRFHGFSTFFKMVHLMIPFAVELSVIVSVVCCVWPISVRFVLSASIYLVF